jgi:hypothetical protein
VTGRLDAQDGGSSRGSSWLPFWSGEAPRRRIERRRDSCGSALAAAPGLQQMNKTRLGQIYPTQEAGRGYICGVRKAWSCCLDSAGLDSSKSAIWATASLAHNR